MSVLSPWAAELLKASPSPSSSLLAPPGSVAPSPSAGQGPLGEHVSLPSMVQMMGRQRATSPQDPSLTAILAAISESLAARGGRGPGTREPDGGMPMGSSLSALAGDPSSADGDAPPGGQPPTGAIPGGPLTQNVANRNPGSPSNLNAPDLPGEFDYDDYIRFVGHEESRYKYNIFNEKGSGAFGKYQFMPDTARDQGYSISDLQSSRAAQEAAMRSFTKQNYDALRMSTGLEKIDPATMYLAHWFGANGATQILFASPMTSMSKLVSKKAVAQNNLEGKTAGDVIDMIRRKYQLHAQRSARGQGE